MLSQSGLKRYFIASLFQSIHYCNLSGKMAEFVYPVFVDFMEFSRYHDDCIDKSLILQSHAKNE